MSMFDHADPDWRYLDTIRNNNLVRESRIAFVMLCMGDCALAAILAFTEWEVSTIVLLLVFLVFACLSYTYDQGQRCAGTSEWLKRMQCRLLNYQSPRAGGWENVGQATCPIRYGDFLLIRYLDFLLCQRELHFCLYKFGDNMMHIKFENKVLVAKDMSELEHKIEKHGGVVLEIDDSYGQVKWRKSPEYIFPSNFNSRLYKAILFIQDTRSIVVNLLWVVMLIIWGVRSGHFTVECL